MFRQDSRNAVSVQNNGACAQNSMRRFRNRNDGRQNAHERSKMKTKIGGQAVLEGVMMRGERSMALSVRDEGGNIRTETTRLADKKPWYRKVPFLRGVVNLVISMIDGTKIINKSAEFMIEDVVRQLGDAACHNAGRCACSGAVYRYTYGRAGVVFCPDKT